MIPTPEEYIKQKGFGQPAGYIPTPDEYLSFKQHQKEWQARIPEAPEREGHFKGWIEPTLKDIGGHLVGTAESTMSLASGAALYLPSKAYGLMALPFGEEAARRAEESIAGLAYQPYTESGRRATEKVGKVFEYGLKPARKAGEIAKKAIGARAGYLTELAAELATFKLVHVAGKKIVGRKKYDFEKKFNELKPEEKARVIKEADKLDTTAAADMAGGKFAGDIKRAATRLQEAKALPAGQGFVLKPGRVPTTKALPPGKAPKLLPPGQGFELIKKVKKAKVEPKKKVPQPLKEAAEKFAKVKLEAKEALESYHKEHGKKKPIVLTPERETPVNKNVGVLIHKSTKKPGGYQATYWDEKGFARDVQHKTEVEAVKDVFREGYKKPDLAKFDKISRSKKFLEGVEKLWKVKREWKSRKEKLRSGELKLEPMSERESRLMKQPKKAKKVKELTIKGAIIKAGYMNLEAYKGEKLTIPAKLRSAITRTKTGIPVDEMVTQLQNEGYIDPRMTPEQFLEKMRTNPEFFEGKKKLGQVDITDRKKSDLTKQERKVRDEIEHEPEGPPKGDYEQINAQDLPVGKNVIVIEKKSKAGWDEYKVIKKDPFEITLEDGETIKLGPLDKVEVLKKDVPKGKAKLVKPKAKEPWEIAAENYVNDYIKTQKAAGFPKEMIDENYKLALHREHYDKVLKAWAEGKPVPAGVLKDYPELAKKPKQAELLKVKPKLFGEPEALKQPKRGPKEKLAALGKVERQATSKFEQKKIGEPTQDTLFGGAKLVKPKVRERLRHEDARAKVAPPSRKELPPDTGIIPKPKKTPVRKAKQILKSEKGQVEIDLSIVKDAGKGARDAYKDIKKMGDEFIGVVSTRLGNIDPKIKYTLRKYEFKKRRRTIRYTKRVLPMLKKVKSMTAADKNAFDLARKNANEKALQGLIVKYKMGPEYAETRKVLNEMYDEAKAAGFDVGYRKHFHPRVIKDSEGFLNYLMDKSDWPLFDEAIKAKEVKLNRYLEADEKAQVINSMLRGYQQAGIKLSVPGQLKARKIEKIWPELNKFYHNSDAALIQYINKVTQAVEGRKIFGKGENINDSIGAYVLDLVAKGKITPKNEIILRDILNARFNEKGTRGVVGMYKNLSYIDTMGSPISALTQIGDLTWALYRNGIPRTTSAVITAIKGKSIIKPKDLGIERIAQEFMEPSRLSNAVNLVFKAVGLEKIDFIGKEALITTTIKKAQAMAKNPKKVGKLRTELKPIFGEETEALITDLKEGYNSENVKLYAFNVLSDFQPITLAEMPQKYLTGGNGRIFYMLKTFTIKQFDVYRREVFQQIKKPGTRIKGIKNLTRLTAYFVAANATADTIKSLVLGRPIIWEDTLVDNILRLFGISKFVTWKAREEGVGSALLRQVLFPVKAIDAATKDVLKNIPKGKKLETPASIPLVGKLYYWWFGKGAEKSKRREKAKQRKKRSKHRISGILRKVKGLKTIKGY